MNRPILTCVFFAFATAAVYGQQPAQSSPYQGQSNPPSDDTITAQPEQPEQQPVPQAKPRAGKPLMQPVQPPATPPPMAHTAPADRSANYAQDVNGTDDGIVRVAPGGQGSDQVSNQVPDRASNQISDQAANQVRPALSSRGYDDPDGDIVHPHPLAPGEVREGTMIRVRLMTGLSTSQSQPGEVFKSHVASDVLQDGKVLIPAGAEIDGRVVEVSEGHTGGHGSIRLRPDTVILLDGQRYRMDAQVTGTPGSRTRVSSEGTINAGSRWKKDGIEYGGAVGAGAVTGAVIAGPVGALTGGLIGAGAITVHLLTDHPQARLEPGTVLLITLNSRLNLVATTTASN
jgi:hypothetical protein